MYYYEGVRLSNLAQMGFAFWPVVLSIFSHYVSVPCSGTSQCKVYALQPVMAGLQPVKAGSIQRCNDLFCQWWLV
jgi:hypothetical protein